jgi:hypothetical protein
MILGPVRSNGQQACLLGSEGERNYSEFAQGVEANRKRGIKADANLD